MNFIKKKLRSHKKDNEEEEYEKAVYEQSLHSGDQKIKNTEEWQFFQQLSMKVQDTVQKTQTTLNKLKDNRQDSVEKDDFFPEGDLLYAANKTASAPPRPPPPGSEKSTTVEGLSDFENGQSLKPPRPPPPPLSGAEMNILPESTLQELSTKSSPARPPPPVASNYSIPVMKHTAFLTSQDFLTDTDSKLPDTTFTLLDEFGFQSTASDSLVVSSKSDFQDLLFLDVTEETDPFDTSFVDVSSIVPCHNQLSGKKDIAPEIASNPFAYDSALQIKDDKSNIFSPQKVATNPFFTISDKKKTEPQTSDNIWSLHNPFGMSGTNVEEELSLIDEISNDIGKVDLKLNDHIEVENVITDFIETSILENNLVGLEAHLDISDITICDSDISKLSHEKFDDSGFSHISLTFVEKSTTDYVESTTHDSVLWSLDTLNNTQYMKCSSHISQDEQLDFGKKNIHKSEMTTEVSNEPFIMLSSNDSHCKNQKTSNEIIKYDNSSIIAQDKNEEIQMQYEPFNGCLSTVSPVDTEIAPVDTEIAPVDTEIAPVDTEIAPVDTEIAPVDTEIAPVDAEIAPVDTEIVPVDTEIAPDIAISEDITNDLYEIYKEVKQDEKVIPLCSESFTFKFIPEATEQFDDFSVKFESTKAYSSNEFYDPFTSGKAPLIKELKKDNFGFGSMDDFDPFKVVKEECALKRESSHDSFEEYDVETDFSVIIKPQIKQVPSPFEPPKLLPPPPKTPTKAFDSNTLRFNPFDKSCVLSGDSSTTHSNVGKEIIEPEIEDIPIPALGEAGARKVDSIETPLSPLFDEDTSLPLETFCILYPHEGWEMVLRQPNKKKLTGNRFWKKVFIKISENSVLQLFNKEEDKLPFQELPLQACYSLSEIGAQQYDQFGKIFTVKLQYKFYRERVGVRPGQISKVTQGHITSMGDVAKLGLPLQHASQTSQLLKLGTHSYSDIKSFMQEIENAFFGMNVHRDRVLTYKTEEIQVIAQDEFRVEQSKSGQVEKQLARVRVFFLAFITGMPSVEVGLNDINRQGKEVVGRYDIIPVVTEEWIRLEDCKFHSCVIQEEFEKTRIIKFHPPDACLFELLRFRIRPPRNRELPLQIRVFMAVSSSRVEIRSDILVPGYSSRKQGQVPCENIQIRFPIPECWIYLFRTEKHFRYGSKKSAARRPGKIKGLERIIGAAQNLDPSLIEVSAGQAKYEHVFHAVVWRIPRLPKEGQGAYTQQLFLLRTELTAFDQIPETFEQFVDVEFTMPATYVSHTTVRSVSVSNPSAPEKYVRYVSKHEYKVEIEFNSPDDIEGLVTSSVTVPVTSAVAQESTEDEKDEDSD